jgi:Flp pilus assembly protein TadG
MGGDAMKVRGFLRKLGRGEEGGALVEASLTLPLLFMLVLGAVEFSRVAYTSLEVVSAAKAGVAYGSQNGGTSGDTAGITMAATTDAANVPGLTVSSISSSYACSNGAASTGLNTDCSTSHIVQTVTVKTQVQLDPIIHVPGTPQTYTIKGEASQNCLQ